jgi:hypothetical protein
MFKLMKFVGDAILLFACVFVVIGIEVIASDPNLKAEIQYLFQTGRLPLSAELFIGLAWVFGAFLTAGFGQIVYALATIAEKHIPPERR